MGGKDLKEVLRRGIAVPSGISMRCSFGIVTVSESVSLVARAGLPRDAPSARGIPDGSLSSEWPCVLGDGALHREATVRANQEGHASLAGRLILGSYARRPKSLCAAALRDPSASLHWWPHRVRFLHCHGGICVGPIHKPCFVSRAF